MMWFSMLTSLAFASPPICLTGARVHLPEGPEEVSVVIADGVIQAIGDVPEDCETQDLSGLELTAGLIESHTNLGLIEVGLEGATRDENAGGGAPVRAAFEVADAYNPQSALIPVARREGITSAIVMPGGGFVSGSASYLSGLPSVLHF